MDLDRLLKDSLQQVGGEFHPSDPAAARQRFLAARRRRRWMVFGETAGAVAMATLLIVFVTTADLGGERGLRITSSAPEVVATIPAGGSPVAVAVGEGAVWMTDSSGVKKIDPRTDEVLETVPMGGGQPDEVVAGLGYVWATDTTGSVYKIDPDDGGAETYRLTDGDDVHLDIALSDSDLWAVEPSTGEIYTLAAEGNGVAVSGSAGSSAEGEAILTDFHPTDVAADGSEVWAFDPDSGTLSRLSGFGEKDRATDPAASIDVPTGDSNSDLAVGFGAAWIASGSAGEVHRVSLDSGEVTHTAEVGGGYADLTVDVDEGAVWALSIDPDAGSSELYELDGRTGEIVGEPLSLDGEAADISAGEGSLWVPGRGGDILKIKPGHEEEVSDEPSPDASPADPGEDLVLVYVQDGDLWAQYQDRTEQLTVTPELESAPTVSPDERYVVFERRTNEDEAAELVTMEIATRGECCFRAGAQPAIGPNDQLAFVVGPGMRLPSNNAMAYQPYIAFSRIGSKSAQSYPVLPEGVYIPGTRVNEVAWDQTGQRLFVETEYEGRSLRVADLILDGDQMVKRMEPADIIPTEGQGTRFMAPSVGTTLNFLAVCCEVTEGGLLRKTVAFHEMDPSPETGYENREIADLDVDLQGFDDPVFTAFVGEYAYEGGNFLPGHTLAWLIGDGEQVWWVDLDGNVVATDLIATDIAAPYPYFD